jgi:secreted PhoX family phosphatase
VTAGITQFQRPEDGAWDPPNPNDFYFVTTASFGNIDNPATPANDYKAGISRLWRLRFVDAADPSLGGTAEVLYEAAAYDPAKPDAEQAGPRMMDNLTVGYNGDIIIQEDPGNTAYVAGIWQYDVATDAMRKVFTFDPALFTPGAPGFLTQDEESSGVISLAGITAPGEYLVDAQVHKANADPELVEEGQLLSITTPDFP